MPSRTTGTTAEFKIFVDGTPMASKTVSLFMTDTLDASLAGAQRLQIRYRLQESCGRAGLINPYVIVTG